jgi:hypothetical protein
MKASLLFFVIFAGMLFAIDAPAAGWRKETRAILREYEIECIESEVEIDEIVKNSHISGHIKGLPQSAYDQFKVIFYVKTNRWYVHPFYQPEKPEEGVSFAAIKNDGTFKIQTIKRRVDASRLAVSVVPAPYVIKSQQRWLRSFLGLFGGVFKYSCNGVVVPLKGEI